MIPVLSEHETTFEEFADNLVQWSSSWVDMHATQICESARELYQNNAIVLLLNDWRYVHDHYEDMRMKNLTSLATKGEPYFLYDEECSKWDRKRVSEVSEAISSLLIG